MKDILVYGGTLKECLGTDGLQYKPYMLWLRGSLTISDERELISRINSLGNTVVMSPEFDGLFGPTGDTLTAINMALSHAGREDDERALSTSYLAGMLPGVQLDHARWVFKPKPV